jgi:hypothetical protein
MKILNRQRELHGLAIVECRAGLLKDLNVERRVEPVILRLQATARDATGKSREVKDSGEIEAASFPMSIEIANIEHVDASDHLIEGAETHGRHVFTNLRCKEEKEIDDVLRLSAEALAKYRILGGYADRARIEMTLAHHDAAHGDERSGCEPEFLGTE